MYRTLGVTGAYLAWTALFILLGGAAFGSLVIGWWRLPKFYLLFAMAFFAYAISWMCAYFVLRGTAGEWIGSLAGSLWMAFVFALAFDALRSFFKLSALLFVTNSVGYFVGSALYESLTTRLGMLLWGVVYGLFFGAGIGAVLHLAQVKNK
jgi:hypothetical protein